MDRHRVADISLSLTHSATSASAVALALPRVTRVPRSGRLAWKFAPFRRDTIVENLRRVFGAHLPGAEIERLAQAHYAHLAKLAGELLRYPWVSAKRKRELVRVEGIEHFTKAWEAKGGILVLAGRFGNFEVAMLAGLAQFPSAQGHVHIVRRPIKPRWLDALIDRRLHKAGFRTIGNRGSLDDIPSLLAKGDAIVFPFDQHAQPPDGIEVEFFGHSAGTLKSLAVIALSTGATVLPAATWREPDGTHVLRFEGALPAVRCADASDEIGRTTRAYNAAIEQLVLRHPEQWWWAHRRWKAMRARTTQSS
jgi:KDO2-lipid IV(A) lauroyltransferase